MCAAVGTHCGSTYQVYAWQRGQARHMNLRTKDTLKTPFSLVKAQDYGIVVEFFSAPMLSISSGALPASRQELVNDVIRQIIITADKEVEKFQAGENLNKIFLANVTADDFRIPADSFARRPPVPVTRVLFLKFNQSVQKRDTITFQLTLQLLPPRQFSFKLPPIVLE